jgi:hypothetical protein
MTESLKVDFVFDIRKEFSYLVFEDDYRHDCGDNSYERANSIDQ